MKIEELKGRTIDILCGTPEENKTVAALLDSNGYRKIMEFSIEPTEMVRCFDDCSYMQHYKSWAGSLKGNETLPAAAFISSNTPAG